LEPDEIKQLQGEAKMFQSFNHPNIQKIEENFKQEDEFAQITEYFE